MWYPGSVIAAKNLRLVALPALSPAPARRSFAAIGHSGAQNRRSGAAQDDRSMGMGKFRKGLCPDKSVFPPLFSPAFGRKARRGYSRRFVPDTVTVFQPSPERKAGRDTQPGRRTRLPRRRFNPRPTGRPGATGWPRPHARRVRRFNLRPSGRPGATHHPRSAADAGEVSTHARPEGRARRPPKRGGCVAVEQFQPTPDRKAGRDA